MGFARIAEDHRLDQPVARPCMMVSDAGAICPCVIDMHGLSKDPALAVYGQPILSPKLGAQYGD